MRLSSAWSATWAAIALAALGAYLAFHSGAFFPGATGVAVVLLAVAVAARLTLSSQPLVGLGRGLGVAVAAMTGLALWTLISFWWSDAPGRAVIEFDRVLLYTL